MKEFLLSISDWFTKLLFSTKDKIEDLFTALDTIPNLRKGWWKTGMEIYKVIQLKENEIIPNKAVRAANHIYLYSNWTLQKNSMQHLNRVTKMYKVLAIIHYQYEDTNKTRPNTKAYRNKESSYRNVVCKSVTDKFMEIIKNTEDILYGKDDSGSKKTKGNTSSKAKKTKNKNSLLEQEDGEDLHHSDEDEEESDDGIDDDDNNSSSDKRAGKKLATTTSTSSNSRTNEKVNGKYYLDCVNNIAATAAKPVSSISVTGKANKFISADEKDIISEFYESVVTSSTRENDTLTYVAPECFTRMKLVRNSECSGVFYSLLTLQNVPEPHHIICIIGLQGIYSEILSALALLPRRLNNVKTLSMLLPSVLKETEFVNLVLTYLNHDTWNARENFSKSYTVVSIHYNNKSDTRKVTTYTCILYFMFYYFIFCFYFR